MKYIVFSLHVYLGFKISGDATKPGHSILFTHQCANGERNVITDFPLV